MKLGRPAGRQGRPMKQKSIDFRELLERLLPLDELPPASRFEVHRALQAGVIGQLEQAALMALNQLELRGALKRLPSAGNGGGRSEEHTSELQSHLNLVCRLLL